MVRPDRSQAVILANAYSLNAINVRTANAMEAEAEAFVVTLGVALVVTFTVGVGDGFFVAAYALSLSNESAIRASKSFLNRDPI